MKFCKSKYKNHFTSLRFYTLKFVQIWNNAGNTALYEAAQDVKLDFGFGKKWRKNKKNKCRYEIFGKKKLKLILEIQHCNTHDFQTTYVLQFISCS